MKHTNPFLSNTTTQKSPINSSVMSVNEFSRQVTEVNRKLYGDQKLS